MDGYAPGTRAPARAGESKKDGGSATNTKFLGEVSQSNKIRVSVPNDAYSVYKDEHCWFCRFAYVTASGLKILAATRQVAVSSNGIHDVSWSLIPEESPFSTLSAQFFSALHKAFVKAMSNPFAPLGAVRESHASTVGTYLEGSKSFLSDIEGAVKRASDSLEYKPLHTPQTATSGSATSGAASGSSRVSAAHAAYANARGP